MQPFDPPPEVGSLPARFPLPDVCGPSPVPTTAGYDSSIISVNFDADTMGIGFDPEHWTVVDNGVEVPISGANLADPQRLDLELFAPIVGPVVTVAYDGDEAAFQYLPACPVAGWDPLVVNPL